MNLWEVTAVAGMALLVLATVGAPYNKARGHTVVFDFMSGQAEEQTTLLDSIENLLATLGTRTQIVVVIHGKGLSLLHPSERSIAERITTLATGKNVQFIACQIAMRKMDLKKEDLHPSASTVDSGLAEIIRRQEDGWSYVKSAD